MPWGDDLSAGVDALAGEATAGLTSRNGYRVALDWSQPGGVRAEGPDGVSVPEQRGLYAVCTRDVTAIREAFEAEACGGDGGLPYVGKAETSLAKRVVRHYFGLGNTPRTALRRSFAALLAKDLNLRPVAMVKAKDRRSSTSPLSRTLPWLIGCSRTSNCACGQRLLTEAPCWATSSAT